MIHPEFKIKLAKGHKGERNATLFAVRSLITTLKTIIALCCLQPSSERMMMMTRCRKNRFATG